MLNRRYLRIKVMQGLYIYFQSHSTEVPKGEQELLRSIDRVYDLYLLLLQFLVELRQMGEVFVEEGKGKKLPTEADLKPNLRFVENPLLLQLEKNISLIKGLQERKLNWSGQTEIIRRTFQAIRSSEEYQEYMELPDPSYDDHKELVSQVFKRFVADSEHLETYLEERSLYWPNDLNMAVAPMILKSFDNFNSSSTESAQLLPLFKDPADDKDFVRELYRKTIIHNKEAELMIGEKTKNWEVERIAMMDVLLMKMTITELLYFPNIPVKVSLNEYIEISKLYSTPKSKVFINGILDKLVIDLKEKSLLVKTGRGLIE